MLFLRNFERFNLYAYHGRVGGGGAFRHEGTTHNSSWSIQWVADVDNTVSIFSFAYKAVSQYRVKGALHSKILSSFMNDFSR